MRFEPGMRVEALFDRPGLLQGWTPGTVVPYNPGDPRRGYQTDVHVRPDGHDTVFWFSNMSGTDIRPLTEEPADAGT